MTDDLFNPPRAGCSTVSSFLGFHPELLKLKPCPSGQAGLRALQTPQNTNQVFFVVKKKTVFSCLFLKTKRIRNYSFDFLKWKKDYVLKKHWLAHTKKTCKRCNIPLIKKYCGKTKRRTFFCENCQVKYR